MATEPSQPTVLCQLCGRQKQPGQSMPLEMVRPGIQELIRADHAELPAKTHICLPDLAAYRVRYIEHLMETDKGELSRVEAEVLRAMREDEILAADMNLEFEEARSLGQRLADSLAAFGGSWSFIFAFLGLMGIWIVWNSLPADKPFDPYPFILLNLVLSCLAALQAPVIMMSQNRQEAKDRLRGEHDYRVNLKAELEIRHLHEKVDHLMLRQWQRLLEIQQVQTHLMEELLAHRARQEDAGGEDETPSSAG